MIFAQCSSNLSLSYGLPVSLFLAGLMGGFTHCAGMCAPFVLAQTKDEPLSLKRLGSQLLLPYHLGRMTTYILLAVALGSIIKFAFLFSPIKPLITAPLLMMAGILFLISAFPQLGTLFPWAARMRVAKPFKFITYFTSKLMGSQSIGGRYVLGILLGFMPCGLVLSALLASASAGTPLGAGLSMMAFAIGTMPALILITLGGQSIKRKYPKIQARLSQGAMVISSLWLFFIAGNMVF